MISLVTSRLCKTPDPFHPSSSLPQLVFPSLFLSLSHSFHSSLSVSLLHFSSLLFLSSLLASAFQTEVEDCHGRHRTAIIADCGHISFSLPKINTQIHYFHCLACCNGRLLAACTLLELRIRPLHSFCLSLSSWVQILAGNLLLFSADFRFLMLLAGFLVLWSDRIIFFVNFTSGM